MTKLADMYQTVLTMAKHAENEGRNYNPEMMTAWASSCKDLADAYHSMREIEIHEEFHGSAGVQIPGEGPIHGGGAN